MDTMVETGTSSVSVGLVPKEDIPILWNQILPILQEQGKKWLDIVDENVVLALLYTGQLDIWCGMKDRVLDGFAICQWERHSKRSYYHIIHISGQNLELYFDKGLQQIERYASILGAYEVVLEGRKGWMRMMKPKGYGTRTVRLRKNVRTLWSN